MGLRQTGWAANAIVVFNSGTEPADVVIPFKADGRFRSALRSGTDLVVRNGSGTAHLLAFSAEIYSNF